jgi:hypothetical protein
LFSVSEVGLGQDECHSLKACKYNCFIIGEEKSGAKINHWCKNSPPFKSFIGRRGEKRRTRLICCFRAARLVNDDDSRISQLFPLAIVQLITTAGA